MDEKPRKRERKVPKKVSRTYLENAALHYLQRYATSAANLKKVLMRKVQRACAHHGDAAESFVPLVDELVARYAGVGLLDDALFANARVTSLRRQGLSERAINAKLQIKGLTPAQIAQALKNVDREKEEPEFEAAVAFTKRKKLGPYRKKAADPGKELAAMGRAGFSFDVAKRALNVEIDED